MAHIQRLYDFQPGTKIASSQVDAEFDQLINFINDKLVQFATANIKYIRLNADKVIETSANGVNWEASSSSGHLIQHADGTILPQRSRLQFTNMTIIDDAANNRTVIQGGGGTQVQLSNRNLIDNPDFAVNQRGQSEYINPDIYFTYAIDRWRLIGTLSVGDGHVVLKKDASPYGYGLLSQLIPGGTALVGKTLTLSAIVNSVLVTATGPLSATAVSTQFGSGDTIGFQLDSGYINVFLYATGNDLTVSRCSLELGEIPTLANSPPADYGEELRKCQRYLWVPDCSAMNHPIAVGLISSTTQAMYMLQFPQRMRIAPTIVPSGKFVAYNTGTHEGTLLVASMSQESCMLMFTITDETTFSTGISTSTLLLAAPVYGSKIIVSAEL